ncbi:MAG: hypothetical protein ACRCYY_16150 [Trueperaceae bacterium]
MKHLLTILLTLYVLSAVSLAQTTDTHQLRVRIPNYIGLKIVDSAGNISISPRASIIFDYAANPNAYMTAIFSTQTLPPTQVDRFADIQVAVRGGASWSIRVRATPLVYTGTATAGGFALGDIRVNRGAVSGLVTDASLLRGAVKLTTWGLATTNTTIFRTNGATQGWDSLGFNGRDYVIRVQGDERPGQYTTVVTYELTFP